MKGHDQGICPSGADRYKRSKEIFPRRSPLRAPGTDWSGRYGVPSADPSFFTSRVLRAQRLWRRPLVGTPGEAYLASRGMPLSILPVAAAIGWNPNFLFRGPAVVFDIVDDDGQRVALNGRFIYVDADPESMNAGALFAGLFVTPGALDGHRLVVTEAPLDALALGAAGVPAVATCGAARHLPKWFVRRATGRVVVVAQDADEVGDQAARRIADQMGGHAGQVVRWRPPTNVKDWADYLQTYGLDALRVALGLASGRDDRPGLKALRRARDRRRQVTAPDT